ncbi:MAG TPA: hypothetical protein VGO67_23120 [Verrucomicrobiae bacterium]|jgi:hypothetical protein
MPQSSSPNRVVSSYFAPGIQVSKLKALSSGAQIGKALDGDVLGDIIKAEVTQVCSGASQYSITFNNWNTTTAADRSGRNGSDDPIPDARELSGVSQPRWPRFKYNDFSLLAFGQRLRVDMRYWPKPPTDVQLSKPAAQAQSWVPMVCGPITDMRFDFTSSSGARVVVSGEDDLSQLKDRRESRKEFQKAPEIQIIQQVLKLAEYPITTIADSQVPLPSFVNDNSQGIVESILDGQSYLEFIQKLADRLDFEVFIEFSDLTNPQSALAFHFEPSRSRVKPDTSSGDVFILQRDSNLVEFTPSIKVVEQPSQSEVKGRHRDRNNPTKVTATAAPSILSDELHPDDSTGTVQELVPGPLVRAHFFPNRKDNPLASPNETNIDPARASTLAEALLRRKARDFFTIEGTALGLPRLRPGNHIQITGMRPPFDGFFYVTKTVHTYGADGLRVKFSARRPGMALPPYGEGQ